MANKTSIEWTDYNWNFLRGCSRVSEGCRNCYAEGVAARFSGEGRPYEGLAKFVDHKPRWTGEISFHEDILQHPIKWQKPRKIFVNSMSDLFHEKVSDEILDKAFDVMMLANHHIYQILTKRPERMLDYLSKRSFKQPFNNHIWLGVSVEDQKTLTT
jgi:protein gp37